MSDRHPRGFASDNNSGAHPDVLAAIAGANEGHVVAYGDDDFTAATRDRFRKHFGEQAEPFLVFNGSGANVTAIDALTRPQEGVICTEVAHMHVDECGAPERLAGTKLLTVPTHDGKLTPDDVRRWEEGRGDEHRVQPRVVSITQATELGTVYTPEETRAIADAAHELGMHLHIDGARLANAAASMDMPLRALTTDLGVDVLSFGGTKNGLLLGDAVVFLRPELAETFLFTRKQLGQLASKMRFLAVQFDALLEAICGAPTPPTPTRWRGGSPTPCRSSTAPGSPTPWRRTASSSPSQRMRSSGCAGRSRPRCPFTCGTRPARFA